MVLELCYCQISVRKDLEVVLRRRDSRTLSSSSRTWTNKQKMDSYTALSSQGLQSVTHHTLLWRYYFLVEWQHLYWLFGPHPQMAPWPLNKSLNTQTDQTDCWHKSLPPKMYDKQSTRLLILSQWNQKPDMMVTLSWTHACAWDKCLNSGVLTRHQWEARLTGSVSPSTSHVKCEPR